MPTIVYVSCADDKQVVVLEMDADTGGLRERSRADVPGTDEPSRGSLPLALSPDRRWLYAALRTPPFPVLTFAIDPASGALSARGSGLLADSACHISTDRTGTRLFSASYGGNSVGVAPIVDGVALDTDQVLATPPKAHSLRVDPENRFAYIACLGGDVLLAQPFDGARLDPVPRPATATAPGAGPRHFTFSAAGTRLYLLNELDGGVNVYAREGGTLRQLQSIASLPETAAGKAAAADIHLTPDGRFLYTSERSTDTLAAFRVDAATGELALIGHVASEPTPRGFAVDPSGRFLLCAGLTSGQVATYSIDQATGVLTRTGTTPVGAGPNWIEMTKIA